MRLLLEGPAIEPLLARVRAEHGPSARIVGAERVRSGGVGGFFAKEHYEVTVEVDEQDDDGAPEGRHDHVPGGPVAEAADPVEHVAREVTSRRAPGAGGARGIDALVAAAEEAERAGQQAGTGYPGAESPRTGDPDTDAPGTGDDLGPHRPLSTESTAFATLLQALQNASAPPGNDVLAGETGGPTGDATDDARTGTTGDAERARSDHANHSRRATPFVPRSLGPEEISHRVRAPREARAEPVDAVKPVEPADAAEPANERNAPEASNTSEPSKPSKPFVPSEPANAPEPAKASGPSGRSEPPAHPIGRRGDFRGRLAATGLPADLLTQLDEDAGPAELLAVLRGLPQPPVPASSGPHVVAVVGERAEATAAARRLADRLGLEPAAVAVPTSVDEAALVAAQVRAHRSVAVAVVDAPFGRRGLDHTVELLRTLVPASTVACVDATRKDADTRAWLDGWSAVGVPVEAVSVFATAVTGDPASVLGLGVPVLEVDGVPGSGAAWFALLMDRIDR